MRHSARTAICAAAVSCLAGVFANNSVKADVFDFTFSAGDPNNTATGTFTTVAPSSTDPGFDLITGLTFDQLQVIGLPPGEDPDAPPPNGPRPFTFNDVVVSEFAPGAAFDPTTLAFINHSPGGPFNNIGGFITLHGTGTAEVRFNIGSPLEQPQPSTKFGGTFTFLQPQPFPQEFTFVVHGPLVITPAAHTRARARARARDLGDDADRLRRARVHGVSTGARERLKPPKPKWVPRSSSPLVDYVSVPRPKPFYMSGWTFLSWPHNGPAPCGD